VRGICPAFVHRAGSLRRERALPATEQPSPEAELEQRQARKLLDFVLEAMSPELRVVLVLFELEGLEISQIAAVQEIPIGTVSSRSRRAREEFSAIARWSRSKRSHEPARTRSSSVARGASSRAIPAIRTRHASRSYSRSDARSFSPAQAQSGEPGRCR